MTTKGKLNPKEVKDEKFEKKAQLNEIEEKIYQTMEVSTLLTQITQQNQRIEELKEQLAKLQEERHEEKETHLRTTRKWEQDLVAKSNEHEALLRELATTRKEHEDRFHKLLSEKNEEIKNLKAEINHNKFESNKKITELNEELKNIQEFKEKQDDYYNHLDALKKRTDELIHQHNDNLKKIDSSNSKAIQMQQDRHEKEINQIVHDAKEEAEKEVGELEKKVMEDNKKLNADLEEYRKEVEALKKEKERAIGNSKQIKVNVSLQEDEIVEYQALHSRQQGKIKKLKEKVQVLKNYIVQEVSKHTKEMETAKYQYQSTINEYETQIKNLQEELKIKFKENKNLKALSQIILDQRSETEEFLLETLDYVKEEVRKQRANDNRMRLPEIWSHPKLESKNRKNWERIDFTSLDWEDKEKILQILFSKMNSGVLPSNWRNNSTFEKNSESFNKSNLNNAKLLKTNFSQSAQKMY